MGTITFLGFALCGIAAVTDFAPRLSYKRHGGLRFVRVGRLSVSFSVSRR